MRRFVSAIGLLFGLFACSPCWATWTLTQVKDNTACSGTTCAVTVTSTGAGHLLIAGFSDSTSHAQTISSVSAAACAGSWVHCTNCAINGTGDGSLDFSYCTNSASGITSITITTSLTMGTGLGIIWEASSTLGNIALDSGATPSGTKTDTTCTSCAGVSLTLSGNNNFIAGISANGGTNSGVTGTGWTNDLTNPNGDGAAHGITSGSQTAPSTWTQSSGTLVASAIAFQETSGGGGGGAAGFNKRQKLCKLDEATCS